MSAGLPVSLVLILVASPLACTSGQLVIHEPEH
jgi:hypothetical protein